MEDATIRPLPGVPALVVSESPGRSRTTLVISDVHLGYGATRDRPEGPPPASIDDLAETVLTATRAAGAGTLLIAGDVKHPIVGVPAALRPGIRRFFATLGGDGLRVEIVPGNHDVGLGRCLPADVQLHSPAGVLHRGVASSTDIVGRRIGSPGPPGSWRATSTRGSGWPPRPTTRRASGAAGSGWIARSPRCAAAPLADGQASGGDRAAGLQPIAGPSR